MEINKSKTKYATDGNICGEFVSRNINYGKDVSRISANICRAVKKNILDLPQLAAHLSERGVNTLPITRILDACKIRSSSHRHNVIRTLYLLSLVYPVRELELLKNSLEEEFGGFIASDEVLSLTTSSQEKINSFKDVFMVYQVGLLLNSIKANLELIIDGITESSIESSVELNSRSEIDKLWDHKDMPIGYLTSVLLLSRSFVSINEMYSYDSFKDVSDIAERLLKTEQRLTFKELGVVSTGEAPWRPKATKLYNFTSSLRLSNFKQLDYLLLNMDNPKQCYLSLLETKLILPYNDPIFIGTQVPVIGQSE
jgi:hypothetical protein